MEDYDIFNDKEILICDYCHNIISEDEVYITVNGRKYHIECWKQMNSYNDEFSFDNE